MAKQRRKLPEVVVVGYQNVKVRKKKLDDVDGHYFARTTPALIEIDKALTGTEEGVTGLHEVMHAIWHNFMPHRKILKRMKPEDLEETVVNALSNGLAQVIKSNPKFVLWLVERLNRG